MMDGILDRLFPQPQYVSGLLGDESQIALQQARQQGLLGLAAGLLQAGGPSRQRTNIGQAIGAGLQAGQQAYRGALSEQIQGQQMAMKLAEQQRLLQQQRALQQAMPTLITQGQPTVFGQQFPVMRDEEGNLMPGVQAGAPQINQEALNQVFALLPPSAQKDLMAALKTRVELAQGPKPEFREVGGALYDVSGGAARQVVAPRPEMREVGGALYQIEGGRAQQVVAPQNAYGLSDLGKLYGAVNFPGVSANQYTPDQLAKILQFQQAPTPAALMDLNIKAQTLKAETGIDLTGDVMSLGRVQPGVAAPVAPAAQLAAQTVAPQAPVTAPAAAAAPQPAEQGFVPQSQNPAVPLKFRNELIAAQSKIVTASRSAIKDMRDLRDAADKVLNHPGLRTASGFFGQPLSMIPGTSARNASELLDNLKNRSFIAGIVSLRQQSPTGSSVGSLTEREGARFENLQASLGQAQTYDQLREQLQQLIRATDETILGLYDAYQLDYGRNRTIEEDLKKSIISPGQQQRPSLEQIFGR